ncbi:hypothetical protein E4U48_006696 [Claviceps purpurea]|nr:hypothetical protein E4U48_006696 [Claviceps purpurea]
MVLGHCKVSFGHAAILQTWSATSSNLYVHNGDGKAGQPPFVMARRGPTRSNKFQLFDVPPPSRIAPNGERKRSRLLAARGLRGRSAPAMFHATCSTKEPTRCRSGLPPTDKERKRYLNVYLQKPARVTDNTFLLRA